MRRVDSNLNQLASFYVICFAFVRLSKRTQTLRTYCPGYTYSILFKTFHSQEKAPETPCDG